jgi:hypothetical protein
VLSVRFVTQDELKTSSATNLKKTFEASSVQVFKASEAASELASKLKPMELYQSQRCSLLLYTDTVAMNSSSGAQDADGALQTWLGAYSIKDHLPEIALEFAMREYLLKAMVGPIGYTISVSDGGVLYKVTGDHEQILRLFFRKCEWSLDPKKAAVFDDTYPVKYIEDFLEQHIQFTKV